MENQNSIFVDVDGCLDLAGVANAKLIAWLRVQRAAGYELTLWSMQGANHARRMAERYGVTDLFAAIISKPRMIIDDHGWLWCRFSRWVPLNDIYDGEKLPTL